MTILNVKPMLACHGMSFPPWLVLIVLIILAGWCLSGVLVFANLFFTFFRSSGRRFTFVQSSLIGGAVGLTLLLCWLVQSTDTSVSTYANLQYVMFLLVVIVPALVLGQFTYLKFLRRKLQPEEIHQTWVSGFFCWLDKTTAAPEIVVNIPEDPRSQLAATTKLEVAGRVPEALAAYRDLAQKYSGTTVGLDAQKSFESLQALTGKKPEA